MRLREPFLPDSSDLRDARLSSRIPTRRACSRSTSNSLRADGIRNWDTKIYRRFVLHERLNMNFAVDMLNMTNHTQFGGPNITVTATNFGCVTGQSNGARQLQLNVRIEF